MNNNNYIDFQNFALNNSDIIFRYLIYRRMFTPYEQENKFFDDGYYEDIHYNFGYIKECVPLPDGDILIGFLTTDPDFEDREVGDRSIQFCKLSEIRLECYEGDQREEENQEKCTNMHDIFQEKCKEKCEENDDY